MAIVSTEIDNVYKSLVVNDTTSNGGAMSSVLAVSGAINNLFAAADSAERAAGSTKYRKAFFKNENTSNLELFSPKLYIDTNSPGDDNLTFFVATHTDTQNDIVGTERKYGAGTLDVTISVGATSIDIAVEDGSTVVFYDGDTVKIEDGTNSEFVTISGTPTILSDVVTIALAVGTTYGYTSGSGTKLSAVYEPASGVIGTYDTFVVTTAGSGDYDDGTNPVVISNLGGVYDDWTITFDSATTFTCSGAVTGSVAGGNTSSDFSPNNPTFSDPYFTLASAGFSGTWAASDTITFTSYPAAIPFWVRRVIPAGAGSIASNNAKFKIEGDTA